MSYTSLKVLTLRVKYKLNKFVVKASGISLKLGSSLEMLEIVQLSFVLPSAFPNISCHTSLN